MATPNDEDTRVAVRNASNQVDTLISHFTNDPDPTWENFGKEQYYLETLRLHLLNVLLCTERELQRIAAVEPTDLGV